MDSDYDYNEEKNQLLKESRGISFEDIINAIEDGYLIANIPHFKKEKYKNQFLLLVKFQNSIYVVPYVKDKKHKKLFLKTIYKSRRFTKIYLKQ
ncbi:hypothetical protein A3A93_00195 [Candidatus Roizmanbacteria bacterium RIFCSPLOWO2_01_FULL_38_12]|uniref:Toxin n=1 Tax=Candidatus Roizmanbacteria bacterium RIFCSPLOWO2_01_FULL_38_12 TaxID=1802061 RepID=A0A1F7IUC2_9BACT|nr:MAG: hypothetical protein A2861_00965 [Candidatus Roizmanbacteria bacterium RIFCSPHIGHO2_01_FULL_38_15]OGK34687.1 MAG: hypothetical protein A3F59_01015 [Candidatus Roizmanbacteria bacterium RIFCSPHIGHO2_12_FULL_38_13]OGK46962.1 MAG: hypothetical protein A3A93_00195 [Candidatus Roizmanbacteria bacterium RIFCSPLOWO2_01_FULL_38_12]